MKKIELLSPAGNIEKLMTAFNYGADSVYLGGKLFSMRAASGNFDNDELKTAIDYAHKINKKVYVAVNIIAFNNELEQLREYIKYLNIIKPDGIIVSDLGVLNIVKQISNIDVHVSTQASNTNYESVKTWQKLGAKRVILARELPLEDIKEIKEKVPDIELEVFVHGAMCIAISGRCIISNYLTNRDANRGMCTQPCRWKYNLVEEKREGEYFPVFEDERGSYIFNSKDLCAINIIDKLIEIGVDSLKIEGRMKGIYYVAVTSKYYREAIDNYYNGKKNIQNKLIEELEKISHRNYYNGFFKEKPNHTSNNYLDSSYKHSHNLVGKVLKNIDTNCYLIEVKNQMKISNKLEKLSFFGDNLQFTIEEMKDYKTNETIELSNPNSKISIKTSARLNNGELIRCEKK